MKLDERLKKRSCIVLKDVIAKNFVANEHHSFTFVFTFSVVVVDLPTETDVLVHRRTGNFLPGGAVNHLPKKFL